MLEYLYALFIAPLEWLMKAVLEHGVTAFGSYGAALICMSIVVNLLLLPLYHLAETWQESERRVQHDMQTYLEHIKAAFKGRERFMLISALYRMHGYHPVYAVRTSFGFLIQVPFFFAAYHFLSHYAPLNGASFWIFHNLAKPDALLHVAGFDINVLPWVMTAINIVSALVYTNRLSRRDKIQLYAVAAIFLVLLYTAPSGLVFYWTCNNIFSLLKNMVYEELGIFSHGESGRKKPKARLALEKAGLFIQQKVSMPWTACLLGIAFCMIVVRCLLAKWAYIQAYSHVLGPVSACVLGLCLVLLLLVTFAWCLTGRLKFGIWTVLVAASFYAVVCHLPYLKSFLVLGLFLCVVLCYQESSIAKRLDELASRYEKKELASYSLKALAFAAMTMFVATPALLLSQDASLFSPAVLAVLTLAFACFVIIPYCVFSCSRPGLRLVLTVCFCTAAFVAFVYTWVLDRDYGVLDGRFLTNQDNLYLGWYKYADLVVCLLLTSAVVFLLALRRRALGIVLNIGLVMTILMGGWNWYNVATAVDQDRNKLVAEAGRKERPVKLSRTHPNVLVIMLDMFTGDHVGYMRDEYPDIIAKYDGFTWYPDTLSEGSSTLLSLSSVVAGPKVAPRNLQADDGKTLEEKISSEILAFFEWLKKHGYTAKYIYTDGTVFMAEKKLVEQKFSQRFPAVEKAEEVKDSNLELPASFGVFKAVPWSLRSRVYRSGAWIPLFHIKQTSKYNRKSRRNYAVLKSLPFFTAIDDSSPHYTFFHNELSHYAWHISEKTLRPFDEGPSPLAMSHTVVNDRIPRHYYAEVAALKLIGDFFETMKKENVYDNTLIIMSSDHDVHDSKPLLDVFGKSYPGNPGALLMIKPVGKHGAMRMDETPMATSDIRMIVEAFIDGKECNFEGNRIRYHAHGDVARKNHKENNFILQSLWMIQGDRMHREHWNEIYKEK